MTFIYDKTKGSESGRRILFPNKYKHDMSPR